LFEICPSRDGQALGSWQDRAQHTRAIVDGRGQAAADSNPSP
jgi:hypothetical protein